MAVSLMRLGTGSISNFHSGRRAASVTALALIVICFGWASVSSVGAADGPDLVVVDTAFFPQQGGGYEAHARVKNVGNQAAGASHLYMQINFPSGQLVGNTFNVPALAAGAQEGVIHILKGSIGSKVATSAFATADSAGEVTESNESNNTTSMALSVGGIAKLPDVAQSPLQATDSSGAASAVLLGVAVAVGIGVIALVGAVSRRRSDLKEGTQWQADDRKSGGLG